MTLTNPCTSYFTITHKFKDHRVVDETTVNQTERSVVCDAGGLLYWKKRERKKQLRMRYNVKNKLPEVM